MSNLPWVQGALRGFRFRSSLKKWTTLLRSSSSHTGKTSGTQSNQLIASPSKFSLKYSLVPKYWTLSSDRIRGPTRSGKSSISFVFQSTQRFQATKFVDRLVPETTSFAFIFPAWLSSRHDTYPKFPRSPLGTPGTTTPFWRAENEKTSETLMLLLIKYYKTGEPRIISQWVHCSTLQWQKNEVE